MISLPSSLGSIEDMDAVGERPLSLSSLPIHRQGFCRRALRKVACLQAVRLGIYLLKHGLWLTLSQPGPQMSVLNLLNLSDRARRAEESP